MKTVDDLLTEGVRGLHVLVRSDLNVPIDNGRITDDGRIRASVPVIGALSKAGARVVVCAHLGRPRGVADPRFSLAPVAARLSELLGRHVALAGDVAGPNALEAVDALTDGGVVLLENVRFESAETSRDDAERGRFADRLAELADRYVDDAFGAVHRRHASVYDIAQRLPGYAGTLVLRELSVLRGLTGSPDRPYLVVLGGAKVSDKLAVIEALLPRVDRLLVGGAMCFTFLAAQGRSVGSSRVEPDMVDTCVDLLRRAGDSLLLPVDVVVGDELSADTESEVVEAAAIPDGRMGLDIGPRTVAEFATVLSGAHTVFWNGPMGVFEIPAFASGTRGVAAAIASVRGLTVVGGGDSAAAVRQLGIDESAFGHISTGGGASLEFLEGRTLPGLAVLDEDAGRR
ncbi:MAG TPA: phosphoglycerate kinase [Mycobacteriales bacterium]